MPASVLPGAGSTRTLETTAQVFACEASRRSGAPAGKVMPAWSVSRPTRTVRSAAGGRGATGSRGASGVGSGIGSGGGSATGGSGVATGAGGAAAGAVRGAGRPQATATSRRRRGSDRQARSTRREGSRERRSGARLTAFLLRLAAVDEPQVAHVDEQARRLADDEHRVAAVDGVEGEDEAAAEAEVPEGGGDHAPAGALGGEPLDEEAAEEEGLAEEADGDQILA